jgi:acetyltransferase-like isoleucine patch superfamily enzyme
MTSNRPSNPFKTIARLWPALVLMPFRLIRYGKGGLSFVHPLASTQGPIRYGRFCEVGPMVFINAGEYAQINSGASLVGNIVIGARSLIAPGVVIASGGHRFGRNVQPRFSGGHNEHHISTVGQDVWIGANATIVGNVMIGDGSVIAAGCTIDHDVPAFSLVKRPSADPVIELLR